MFDAPTPFFLFCFLRACLLPAWLRLRLRSNLACCQPIPGDWNGAGCHTNYSTRQTRDEDNKGNGAGYKEILVHLEKLKAKHQGREGKGREG